MGQAETNLAKGLASIANTTALKRVNSEITSLVEQVLNPSGSSGFIVVRRIERILHTFQLQCRFGRLTSDGNQYRASNDGHLAVDTWHSSGRHNHRRHRH